MHAGTHHEWFVITRNFVFRETETATALETPTYSEVTSERPVTTPQLLIYQADVLNAADQHFPRPSRLGGCRVSKAPPTVSGITRRVWTPDATNSSLALLGRCYIGLATTTSPALHTHTHTLTHQHLHPPPLHLPWRGHGSIFGPWVQCLT